MEDQTRVCPMCAETIKLEAKVCRFCRAQFEIQTTGYCETCHATRSADDEGHCTQCGSQLTDLKIESRLISTAAAPSQAVPAPAPPARSRAPSKMRCGLTAALVVLLAAVLCVGALAVINTKDPFGMLPTTPAPTLTKTPVPTNTPKPTPTSTPAPVVVTFDTIGSYPKGTPVILSGLLTLFKSTFCDSVCGLLLAQASGSDQKITIFVSVARAGEEPALNQMKALADNFGKWDIVIRLADGNFAYIDNRITVTGKICSTTDGKQCISDIIHIELENK